MERFNRERFGTLNKQSYEALANMAVLRERHPGECVIGRNDFVEPMSVLFKDQWEHRFNERIFLLTKKVGKKIDAMNAKALVGPLDVIAPILKEDDRGYIVLPKESWNNRDDINAYYLVTNGKLYMHVCCGQVKVGYVVADKAYSVGVELLPWSPITMIYRRKFCHESEMKPLKPLMRGLIEDFPSLREGDAKPMWDYMSNFKNLKKAQKEKKKSLPAMQMHGFAHMCIYTAFKAFVFLKTSEVYSKTYVPDSTPTFMRKRGFKPLNYIQVDTTWDMNIDVNTPFPVRGHLVHQPCKVNGEWTRKIIYVEQFMKKGYHRRAKKTIEEEKKHDTLQ